MMTDRLWGASKSSNQLKFISLGYSSSGKTYYLGSLYRLRFNSGPHGFSIKGDDDTTTNRIEEIYQTLVNKKSGAIMTTVKMDTIKLIFQKKLTNLFDVQLTDIFGQATEVGRNVEEANKLISKIPEHDGVIIFLKTPTSYDEYDDCIDQLNRLLDLTAILLNRKRRLPVALVLTQIDRLNDLSNISEEIERQFSEVKDQYEEVHGDREQKLKFAKRDVINSMVKDAINTPIIKSLIDHFHNKLRDYPVACKVFPATSLGFDNSKSNPNGIGTNIAKGRQIHPYGTLASFLWMIYAFSRLYPGRQLSENYKPAELLEELNDLYMSGQAYEDSTSSYFNIRNLGDLKV